MANNMQVFYENNGCKHVSVAGELISKNEEENLLEILEDKDTEEVIITFLDANILNCNIVEKLELLQKTRKCKIYVLKRYLYSYLYSLGIKSEYTAKRSVFVKPMNNKAVEEVEELKLGEVNKFLKDLNITYGHDYTGYQTESIMRRIKISMLRENIRDFSEYQAAVLRDREIFDQLFLDFSINTTEFFRDPDVFSVIRNKVLPYLNSYTHFKVWCVGCSNGKEAYSLAIMLDELGMLNKAHIYATDINPYIIEEAKNGLFSMESMDVDINNYKKAGGNRNFVDYLELKGSYVKIKRYLQKNILFFQHSLVGSGILNEFQLILCRNVLIYFKPELQEKVLENFYKSFDVSGFLVLGKSEGLLLNRGYSYFSRYTEKEKIYKVR